MKFNWHAVGGFLAAAAGVILSPQFLAYLPAKYAAPLTILGAAYAAQSGKAVPQQAADPNTPPQPGGAP